MSSVRTTLNSDSYLQLLAQLMFRLRLFWTIRWTFSAVVVVYLNQLWINIVQRDKYRNSKKLLGRDNIDNCTRQYLHKIVSAPIKIKVWKYSKNRKLQNETEKKKTIELPQWQNIVLEWSPSCNRSCFYYKFTLKTTFNTTIRYACPVICV